MVNLYLFVAIHRNSKFSFVKLIQRAETQATMAFLQALVQTVPYRSHTVLADNGIQFADLPMNRNGITARFRGHPFDKNACSTTSNISSQNPTIPGPTGRSNA